MILAARRAPDGIVTGVNVLLLAEWQSSPETWAAECFLGFDDSLLRVRNDPEATRVGVPGAGQSIGFVQTASEIAVRTVPERMRSGTRFHSIVYAGDDASGPCLWTDLPAWGAIRIENEDGSSSRVDGETIEGWRRIPLEAGDRRAVVTFFDQAEAPLLDVERFWSRTSELVLRGAAGRPVPALSFAWDASRK